MKNLTAKTYMKQLLKRFGSKKLAAEKINISLRYFYMLEKGDRSPGKHLRAIIKQVLSN